MGGLKTELKQSRPFRSLEEELTLNITRTAAVLEHALAQALKPYDITPTQYNVLRILRGAGSEGLCRNEVGQRLLRRVPDVTRLLDRMEDMNLIVRERGSADRRFVSTTVTRKGLDILDRLDRCIDTIHRDQLGHLDEKAQRQLIGLLTAAREKP
jgi:DNA-binding MarR family transcriptional regulator